MAVAHIHSTSDMIPEHKDWLVLAKRPNTIAGVGY